MLQKRKEDDHEYELHFLRIYTRPYGDILFEYILAPHTTTKSVYCKANILTVYLA